MNYYKQTDSSNVSQIPAYHDGEGIFDVRKLFEKQFQLPIKAAIWELKPGSGEGIHRPGFAPDAKRPLIFVKGRQIQFQLEPTGRIELPTCCLRNGFPMFAVVRIGSISIQTDPMRKLLSSLTSQEVHRLWYTFWYKTLP